MLCHVLRRHCCVGFVRQKMRKKITPFFLIKDCTFFLLFCLTSPAQIAVWLSTFVMTEHFLCSGLQVSWPAAAPLYQPPDPMSGYIPVKTKMDSEDHYNRWVAYPNKKITHTRSGTGTDCYAKPVRVRGYRDSSARFHALQSIAKH
jgi:hypothetical protein